MNRTVLYEVVDVWKSYTNGTRKVEVLKGVSLSVHRGDSVAVMGPSGVGKTTLLHVVGLLDRPETGKLVFDGVDTSGLAEQERAKIRNGRIGFVFQFFQLLPEFSALENVVMPGLIAREPERELRKRAMRLLAEVGLKHRASHRPGELSGGEQQRVALARALVMNPELLLADEPTGNLDPDTGAEIECLMQDLNRTRETTMIVVTHKESLSRAMHRRVGLIGGKLKELE
jgi:lipoprotein-releasing system ATP-binding protein